MRAGGGRGERREINVSYVLALAHSPNVHDRLDHAKDKCQTFLPHLTQGHLLVQYISSSWVGSIEATNICSNILCIYCSVSSFIYVFINFPFQKALCKHTVMYAYLFTIQQMHS